MECSTAYIFRGCLTDAEGGVGLACESDALVVDIQEERI